MKRDIKQEDHNTPLCR